MMMLALMSPPVVALYTDTVLLLLVTYSRFDESITIAAEPDIEYSTIIATMDAIRRDESRWLFPDVTFGPAVKTDAAGAPQ